MALLRRKARRTTVVLVTALCAGLLGGCGSDVGSSLLMAEGVKREQPPGDAPVAATVDGVSRLGYDLFGATAKPDENTVLSPLSVAYAFAMARAGANGETATQMDEVFGFPTGVHGAFNSLSRQIVTVDGPPPTPAKTQPGATVPPTVAIANGLFLQEDYVVREAFLNTLAAKYGAGVRTVDFRSGNAPPRRPSTLGPMSRPRAASSGSSTKSTPKLCSFSRTRSTSAPTGSTGLTTSSRPRRSPAAMARPYRPLS